MNENKLKLNEDKTEFLVLSSSRQKHKIQDRTITIGNSSIHPSATAKNLGVMMDSHLTMESQINSVCRCSSIHLRNIGKIRKYLTPETAAKIMHAFISSRLDYNNALLYGIPKTQIQRLQRIQNTAARIVTCCKKSDHITPHLQNLHWLPVHNRIKYKIITLTYRCLHDIAPAYLCDLIHLYHPGRSLRSSTSLSLTVPKTNLKGYWDCAFSKAAPVLWNQLPQKLKSIESFDMFKSELKTFLFKDAFNTKEKL
jgi:hypothetical protein